MLLGSPSGVFLGFLGWGWVWVWPAMQTLGVLYALVGGGVFLLLLIRRWWYLNLCFLVEGCWGALISLSGLLATTYNEGGVLMWGLVGLIVGAGELCLCLMSFILWVDMRGGDGGP